jgi:hypothetical protein
MNARPILPTCDDCLRFGERCVKGNTVCGYFPACLYFEAKPRLRAVKDPQPATRRGRKKGKKD